jgi:hypothetical protein
MEAEEADPEITLRLIVEIIRRWRVQLIGVDYGGGYDRNHRLARVFGARKVVKYQYANPSTKVQYQPTLGRFMVRRTEILLDVIESIKRGEWEFPRSAEFMSPFGEDMTSVFSEYNESMNSWTITKSPGATDDTLHSVTMGFLASMLVHPRHDILTPGV